MTRRVVEKLYTKKVCVDFLAPRGAVTNLRLGTREEYSKKSTSVGDSWEGPTACSGPDNVAVMCPLRLRHQLTFCWLELTLHSENIARAKKFMRNCFPRDCAKLSQSIARTNSWGIVFRAIAQFCCCSLLSYCSCSMLPKIDLRNGHFVIAPNYFWRIISGWIARNSRNDCAK